jgi:hypothetical protein
MFPEVLQNMDGPYFSGETGHPCAKDLARVTGSLVSSARVSSGKVGLFSKEAASTIKNLIETAKAASLSDGTAALISLNGSRIVKGADYILENPDDGQRVVGVAKKITQAAAILNLLMMSRLNPTKTVVQLL